MSRRVRSTIHCDAPGCTAVAPESASLPHRWAFSPPTGNHCCDLPDHRAWLKADCLARGVPVPPAVLADGG